MPATGFMRAPAARPFVRVVPPPVVLAACIALGLGLHRLQPAAIGLTTLGPRFAVALPLVAAAAWLGTAALLALRRHRTTPEPWRVPTALVTGGPFRLSRNPIYVALLLFHLGLAAVLDRAWLLATWVPLFVWLDRRTVPGEEAILEREFGDAFRRYRAQVRRWL